jgi:hypothetical protein
MYLSKIEDNVASLFFVKNYFNVRRNNNKTLLDLTVYVTVEVAETIEQIGVSDNPDTIFSTDKDMDITAAGSTQADALLLDKYLNKVTSATPEDASTVPVTPAEDSVKLPSADSTKVLVVINAATIDIKVYPGTGEEIDSLGIDQPYILPVGGVKRFVAVEGVWQSI